MLPAAPDYLGVAARVMRPDFYEAAMNELGVSAWQGKFSTRKYFSTERSSTPTEPEKYAADFEISGAEEETGTQRIMNESILKKIDWLILPAIGVAICIVPMEPDCRQGGADGSG